jgi:dephospho-CoA kinase
MVLSADTIAREIVETDPGVRLRIQKLLGDDVYRSDGTFDRSLVAGRVFRDKKLLLGLNGIVHPLVLTAIGQRTDALPFEKRRPYVIVEAALIYESGMDSSLDRVLVVDAPEETRIARVMARDGVSREDVERRIRVQTPASTIVSRADFVIVNDLNVMSLETKVGFLDTLLCTLAPPLTA